MAETDTTGAASTGPPQTPAAPAPPPWWPPAPPAPPAKKSGIRKILTYVGVLILLLSLVINVYLVAILAALGESIMAESMLKEGAEDQVVAVYEISGVITPKSAASFETFFRLLGSRKDVKAVVLRVDSPGGYVGASDQICKLVGRIRKEYDRPVVVSMGGVAASGGYYVSAPANVIFAEPTTITASIGVIMQFPVVHDWLEKHGLKMVTIRSSQAQRYKAAINYFENPDPEILRERQKLLDTMHEKFVDVIKAGRGDKVKTKAITVKVKDFDGKDVFSEQVFPFNGQVLTSKEALDAGLVDKIGYLDDAIKAAAELAKLDNPRVIRFARARGILARMLSSADVRMPEGIEAKLLGRFLNPRPMMIWEGP